MRDRWRSAAARAILRHAACNEMREAIHRTVAEAMRDVATPPTDLSAVAARLGVAVRPEEIDGSGELRRSGSNLEIIHNPHQSVPRQRFTIAHELGHVLIRQVHLGANQHTKEVERLCDLIAAELLMPEPVFRQDCQQPLTPSTVFSLARRYQTSVLATAHRCAELSTAAIMIASGGSIEKISEKLRDSNLAQNDELIGIVRRACSGERGSLQLIVTHKYSIRSWNIHYQPLGGDRRALLVLTPAPLPAPVNLVLQPEV